MPGASPDRSLGPSGHLDTFTRDRLPPPEQWPDLLLDGFNYPEILNAGVELTDAMVRKGFGDHTALIGNGRHRTYKSSPTGPTGSRTRWSRTMACGPATGC